MTGDSDSDDSSSRRVVVRRRFIRERDDDDTSRPLDRCLEWVRDAGATEYMVLAHETATTVREYEALTGDELRRWATSVGVERHAHEVIAWPTKLYGDVDLEPSSDAAERFDRALAALVAAAERRFSVVCSTPVVLDASSSSKFSRHFTIEMRVGDGAAPRRFATSLDCGAFVRSVDEARDVCDMAVYRRNNCLRVYGSTKLADRRRCFVPLGGRVDVAPERLDWPTLVASLVTWPRVVEPTTLIHVADAAAAPAPAARKRTAAANSLSTMSDTERVDADTGERLADAIDAIRDAGVLNVRRSTRSGMLFVATASRRCAKKGGEHRSNTIYFLVDERRRRYKQLCYSPKCPNDSAQWVSYTGGGILPPVVVTPEPVAVVPPPKRARSPLSTSSQTYPARVCGEFLKLMSSSTSTDDGDYLRASAPV